MTGKTQVRKSWQLAEQHGLWWAYEGDLPPPEAFQTHDRPRHLPILGPYPSRIAAEILSRASTSVSSSEWRDDDYDVLADGVLVGRIMKAIAAPEGTLWLWAVAHGFIENRRPTHGHGDARGGHGRAREELVRD